MFVWINNNNIGNNQEMFSLTIESCRDVISFLTGIPFFLTLKKEKEKDQIRNKMKRQPYIFLPQIVQYGF